MSVRRLRPVQICLSVSQCANQVMERRLSSLQALRTSGEPSTSVFRSASPGHDAFCEAVGLSFSRQVSPALAGLTSSDCLMGLVTSSMCESSLMSREVSSRGWWTTLGKIPCLCLQGP